MNIITEDSISNVTYGFRFTCIVRDYGPYGYDYGKRNPDFEYYWYFGSAKSNDFQYVEIAQWTH